AIMGKPAVVADLPGARQHFDADMLEWYASGEPQSVAEALLRLVDDPPAREHRLERAAARARGLSWDAEPAGYARLVDEVAVFVSAGVATDSPPGGSEGPVG